MAVVGTFKILILTLENDLISTKQSILQLMFTIVVAQE